MSTAPLRASADSGAKRKELEGWSIRDVGYFHPDLEDAAVGTSEVVTIGKETHWRSVCLFIDQVRAQCSNKTRTEQITAKFPQLLRGRAQLWWTSMLSD
ncbi:uncharacterized protein F4807DRAFT_462970 [Annulohypoxylon truncatum]|uniref:uncharacterized protein n=1 Tax=Annulohypoxylon truncatum TaxID=327061 RepID=UPI002008C913|nr:uncharacterized protein F4807DRAFT_462970 [Annulohypoxylon truncatum]KAI1207239.1 hypothetical protein F4807DRAFT_462970 [Annulohypoxylon truncatum]